MSRPVTCACELVYSSVSSVSFRSKSHSSLINCVWGGGCSVDKILSLTSTLHRCLPSSLLELSAWKGGCSWWRRTVSVKNTKYFKDTKPRIRWRPRRLRSCLLNAHPKNSWRHPSRCLWNTSHMEEMEKVTNGKTTLYFLGMAARICLKQLTESYTPECFSAPSYTFVLCTVTNWSQF